MNKITKNVIIAFIYAFVLLMFIFPICKETENYYIIIYIFSVPLFFTIIYLINTSIKCRINYDKVPKYDLWMETNFSNIHPMYAGYLIRKSDIDINGVIATIFLLEDKEIFKIDIMNNEYFVSLSPQINKEKFNKLEDFEQKIVKLLFKSFDDKTVVNINEKIKEFDKQYDYKLVLNELYKDIKQQVRLNFFNDKFNMDIDDYKVGWNAFLSQFISFNVINVIFGWLIVAFNFSVPTKEYAYINLILYLLTLFLLIFMAISKQIKYTYVEEINRLNGLYEYLIHYSNIKDMEIKYEKLYDKFFLYAVGMGIADKFEKEFSQGILKNKFKLYLQIISNRRTEFDDRR